MRGQGSNSAGNNLPPPPLRTEALSPQDNYCLNVCKGYCCTNENGHKCSKQNPDGSCSIYDQWVDGWCHHKEPGMTAVPIMEALANNWRPDIVEFCCYSRPELLEV